MTETIPTAAEPTPGAPAAPAEPPVRPSGWAPWKKRTLRWATGLLAVFALGLAAVWLVQVRPLQQHVAGLEQQRESLQSDMADLQEQVARLEGVEAENTTLKARTTSLEQTSALLKASLGTLQAQFILGSGGEPSEAAEVLAGANDQLALLEKALEGTQQDDIRALRYRLAMAAEEIQDDPFAAQRDLEVLANGLETMLKELAGE